MGNRKLYGNRRGSRSGDMPEHRHLSPPPEPEVTSGAADQGGTPEDVLQSGGRAALLTSIRGMARLLQATLNVWLTSPGLQPAELEELNDIVKPAIDALWRIK